jgi:hypothetical protein
LRINPGVRDEHYYNAQNIAKIENKTPEFLTNTITISKTLQRLKIKPGVQDRHYCNDQNVAKI